MTRFNGSKNAAILLLFFVATAVVAPAQVTFTTLVSFHDGALPGFESLVQGLDGNFYGTTGFSGTNDAGTVFKITPAGVLTTFYSFCSQTLCTDGFFPYAGLVQATDRNFYGTTESGGTSSIACPTGCGTVFKVTRSGTLTTLHSFDSTDGANPNASLVQATDGNFHGTTPSGGASSNCPGGCGTVFKITRSGTLTTLHSFDSTDGAYPNGLMQATDGNFYGTTSYAGANNYGTVFKITPSGVLATLYNFADTDGGYPYAGLVQASDGNFYGTTSYGGANAYGTVFKITPSGTLTTLHSFDYTDGYLPGVLVQATDGNFYGTTTVGGANTYGTVFKMTPSGRLTTLHGFDNTDGYEPGVGLVQGTDGSFYGTTTLGGAFSSGTAFNLSVGLGAFVETLPIFGKAGSTVKILGNNLTGSTGVSFNGTAATFKVVSSTEITTTVPTGATTGTVSVATPGGTLNSNAPFRVIP